MVLSNKHIANIITTNKVTSTLDLNTIKIYIKNINVIDSNEVISLKLPQSKLYLKILDISYFTKNSSISITADMVEKNHSIYTYL